MASPSRLLVAASSLVFLASGTAVGAPALRSVTGSGVSASNTDGASPVGTESRSCAWTVKIDPDGVNAAFPDQAARYWILRLPAGAGTSLTLRGEYPHARYTSFTSYDDTLRSADGLPDVNIHPDRGSANPFLPGASRRVPDRKRHYTVHVVFGQVPKHRARNTLYTTSADGSRAARSFQVALRIYEPDRGLTDNGGVPLPSVTVNTSAGSVTLPDCATPDEPSGTNGTVADLPAPYTGSGSSEAIVWHKFYNLPAAVAVNFGPGPTKVARTLPKGGFADNPDNKYVAAVIETLRAPAVVITGRLPRTPATYFHDARMSRHAQLRYWSMCSNELASERFYGCVMDDQMPLRAGHRFTLVITTAADRPANATDRCGIAWLPAGPAADTVLIERNMLPDPHFRHSIQAARYDHEKQDLGAYYPDAHYRTIRQVTALGCHAPVNHPRS
jgi:hypothetical protein